jgi:hypothetical protein
MTPTPTNNAPLPWWQTLLITVANVAVGALINHYLGPGPAVGGMAAGTAIAHALPSPFQRR